MGIAVLGPLTIEGEHSVLGRRDRVVLAALAVHPGDVVSAEALADVMWEDRLPQSWPKIVQGCVVRLRKVLGSHAIETSALGYRLTVPLDAIDAQRFDRAVTRSGDLLAAGDAERAAVVLADALRLWRGRPLIEVEGWDPARIEVTRLVELRQAAEELYVEAALRAGQHGRVLAKAQSLVTEAPLRERRWALLATAQYQSGRQGEALQTLRRLRSVLDSELGLDSSPDIDTLEQAILRQDPSLVVDAALPEPSPVCPYPGLRPYDVDDADGFFGRDADIAACLRKVTDASVVAVVGPSGCGKSSLVRAGVAAALRRDGQRVVVMTPGVHPVAALADAMPGAGPPPTLLVDQCEEVFSLCHDLAERDAFLSTLAAHTAPLILSLRADRMADLSSHPAFARTVEHGLHVLAGMTESELRTAIEQPARLASLVVEPGLVDLLVGEVADHPGALPLMSHALAETWQRREGRTLTVAGYNDSGGIRGAVAQSAEAVYERVPAEQHQVLRDLMLRLIAPGPEGEPVRSRLPRRLVVAGPENDAMIDLLIGARLVTSDDGVVELAHESLARAWPRLRGWLDDDLDGQRILHHLAGAADSWDGLGRPDSELYRGVRLAKALDWQQRTTPTLTATELEFLAQGKRLSETELRAAEDQTRRHVRVNRRLRAALGTAAFLLIGALIAGLVAVQQADRADRQAAEAQRAAVAADAKRVGTRALLSDEISLGLLLGVAGVRLDDSGETRANLYGVLDASRRLVRSVTGPHGQTEMVAVSPDGSRIALSDASNGVHLYDASTSRLLRSVQAAAPPTDMTADAGVALAYSPDGRSLAVAPWEPSAEAFRLLDPVTLRVIRRLPWPRSFPGLTTSQASKLGGWALQFSSDGRRLAATVVANFPAGQPWDELTSVAVVWDLKSPGAPPAVFPLGHGLQGMALSPDARTMYTAWPVTAYDVATGRQLWQRKDVHAYPTFNLSPDGKTIVAVFQDGVHDNTMAVIDTRTPRKVRWLREHTEQPRGAAFSRDGKLFASVSHDGETIIWDVDTWTPRQRWRTLEQSWGAAFGSEQRLLYTTGSAGVLRTWDLAGRETLLHKSAVVGPSDNVHADVSPDGSRVAYRRGDSENGRITFADTATGATVGSGQLPVYFSEGSVPGAWSHDSARYAAFSGCFISCPPGAVVSLFDVTSGKRLADRQIADTHIDTLAFVGGDRRWLAGDNRGQTYLLDADTLRADEATPRRRALRPSGCCPAVSPDGRTAVMFEYSPSAGSVTWRVVDLATSEVRNQGTLGQSARDSDFSPDGSTVAVSGQSGELWTIDIATGRMTRASTVARDEVWHVKYSGDGSRIVTGGRSGTASLWDAKTLQLIGTVKPPHEGDPVSSAVAFVKGTTNVMIASYDGQVFVWDTSLNHALDMACQMAGRNLTQGEWSQFLPNQPYRKVCAQFG